MADELVAQWDDRMVHPKVALMDYWSVVASKDYLWAAAKVVEMDKTWAPRLVGGWATRMVRTTDIETVPQAVAMLGH